MKKFLNISIIVIILMCLIKTPTTAVMQCKITLDSMDSAVEVKKGDEFVIDVKVSEISSERGLVTLGATIDYDKSSLKLKALKGVGDYSTPAFNENNGKLILDREPTNHNATMFTITFEVINTDNVKVTLKDISVSDGTGLTKIEDQTYTPKVKQEKPDDPDNPNNPSDPDDPDNPGDNNQGGNNGGNNNQGGNNGGNNNQGGNNNEGNNQGNIDTIVKDDKLPQTGDNKTLVKTGICGIAIIAAVAYTKFLNLNKKMIR